MEATWRTPPPLSPSTTVSTTGPAIHSGLRTRAGSAVKETWARRVSSSSGTRRTSRRCSPAPTGSALTAR
ncbi:hypothetical protein [Nonomuraea recticatena]|uniref:hypothetical protein n=1 Tax=Nonomuraea recticatena TaxID=46178 RepID=UPI0036141937